LFAGEKTREGQVGRLTQSRKSGEKKTVERVFVFAEVLLVLLVWKTEPNLNRGWAKFWDEFKPPGNKL